MNSLIIALIAGTVVMFGTMLLCRHQFTIPLWKLAVLAVLVALTGLFSTKIMSFVESGSWKGTSFFGAVFLLPLWLIPIARLLRIPACHAIDITAPCVYTMLAVMKVKCLIVGCCRGRILWVNEEKEVIRFPSQWAELIAGLLLAGVMIYLICKGTKKGKVYPVSMIVYGIVRFILNWFRETTPFIWLLPAGNFWSLIAIAAGLIWLWYLKKHPQRKER